MRGKDRRNFLDFVPQRITPAYAGKSIDTKGSDDVQRDHPRLCGEKLCETMKFIPSSRITPAYAGKSNNGYDSGMIK